MPPATQDVKTALAELAAHPKTKANHVVQLIAALEATDHEATQRAILQGLKLFFVDSGLEGLLQPPSTSQESEGDKDAVAVFRSWLRRQYSRCVTVTLSLVTSATHSASIQVAATTAVMEFARAEAGPGALSGPLLVRLITAVTTSPSVHPEVFSLLFSRYFQFADVWYYTLWAVRSVAASHASRGRPAPTVGGGSGQAGGDGGVGEQAAKKAKSANGNAAPAGAAVAGDAAGADGQLQEAAEAGSSQQQLPLADLCRNLFDVLTALPASLRGCSTAGAGDESAAGQQLKSWCGATEAGVVAAKSDKNESARQRRKRKAEEGAEGLDSAGVGMSDRSGAGQVQRALWANSKTQKRLFSDAWLALLSLDIPVELLSKILLYVHETLIPNMMHPALLADFLTHCLGQGGLTGMLALNGIFQLVTQHGLEYPAFYTRLYALITPSAMASKHRAQFFALADVFLTSPLVPAYTVASFAKRLARIALRTSPAGALLAIAFIHNVVRRHPSCMVLLHNPTTASKASSVLALDDDLTTQQKQVTQGPLDTDPFLPDEPEPSKTRAIESSLWELEALQNHYAPHVSTLSSVLERDLTDKLKTSEVDVGPLLTTSYASLFEQEVTRRIKQVPIAFYAEPPTSLFGPHCAGSYEGWVLPGGDAAGTQA